MVSKEASFSLTFGTECLCPMTLQEQFVVPKVTKFEPYLRSTSFSHNYMCIYCHSTSHKSSSCLLYYCSNCLCYHPRQKSCPRYKTNTFNLRTRSSTKTNWRNKMLISAHTGGGFSAKHWKKKKQYFTKSKSCPPRL